MMWYFLKCFFGAFLMIVSGVTGRVISDIDNPVVPINNCRRPASSYVCDPDELLTDNEGKP